MIDNSKRMRRARSLRTCGILIVLVGTASITQAYINRGFRSKADEIRYDKRRDEEAKQWPMQMARREQEMFALINQAILRDSKDAVAYYRRGQMYTDIYRFDADQALADFDEAIRLQPDFSQALMHRGALHAYRKDYASSVADMEAAMKISPTEEVRYRLAILYYATDEPIRDLAKARIYAEGLEFASKSKLFNYRPLMAAIYAEQGDFVSAVHAESPLCYGGFISDRMQAYLRNEKSPRDPKPLLRSVGWRYFPPESR